MSHVLKQLLNTFFILSFAFCLPLKAIETRYQITVDNSINSNLPEDTLISHMHFSKPNFSESYDSFAAAYKVIEKASGNIIFDDLVIIQSNQSKMTLGDVDSGKLTISYYPKNEIIESSIQMRVTEGKYILIVNGLDNESLKHYIASQ